MAIVSTIRPCLWFDNQAEEAAEFYTGIFPNSKITTVARYGTEGQDRHGRKPGSVMMVAFELNGWQVCALNAGPQFKFSEAVSFMVSCDTQDELDYYWGKLSADPKAEICGWCKDKFGLSWQICHADMDEMMRTGSEAQMNRVMKVVMASKKLDIAEIRGPFVADAGKPFAFAHAREVAITRMFDAPRETVFAAWTDPKHLARWFGPRGFTNPVCTVEARVGGQMRITMRADDAIAAAIGSRDHPVQCVFREFEPPSRLGFTNNAVDADGNVILEAYTTVIFEDHDGKTKMIFHTRAGGSGDRVPTMLQGMQQGWSESFDKLAEILT